MDKCIKDLDYILSEVYNGRSVATAVNSSNISTVCYNPMNKVLTILFQKGKMYQYKDIDITDFVSLITAKSVGSMFHSIIKQHQYKLVEV